MLSIVLLTPPHPALVIRGGGFREKKVLDTWKNDLYNPTMWDRGKCKRDYIAHELE